MNKILLFLKAVRCSYLVKSASTYTCASIINKTIPVLLLPILTRYLSPEDYGIVSMFAVMLSLTSVFIGVNTQGAIIRKYFDKDEIDFASYISNCLYILVFSTFFVSLIFYYFSTWLSKYSSIPEKWLWFILLMSFTQFVILTLLSLLRVQLKAAKFGLFQISQTALNILLSIVFVIGLKMDWRGRISALVITNSVFAIISFILLVKHKFIKFDFKLNYIKDALKFGLPLIPHSLGAVTNAMIGRFLVTNMLGVYDTGMYSVAIQIGSIISLVSVSFNNAYAPWLFGQLKKSEFRIKIKIVKFTYLYFFLILLLVGIVSCFIPIIIKTLVAKKFSGSSKYIFWIMLGYAFEGMYFMVTNYIFYTMKTTILAMITFLSAIVNLVSSYFFIVSNGAIGAAQGFTLSLLISFFLTWFYSARVYRMPWFSFYRK